MTDTLAFVIPWYGEDIPGGAEAACRSLVKTLSRAGLPVEVLTTCVREFRSDWSENHHPEGQSSESGVKVRRFRVRPRDTAAFDRVNYKLMQGQAVSSEEEQIFVAEMINSPGLYEYIDGHRNQYVFLFIPYMFGTTYWGSQVCPERSLLIPCLHDESYARMEVFRRMVERVKGLIFLSPEEQNLAQRLYHLGLAKTRVIGVPLDCSWQADRQRFVDKYGVQDFLLYAGRTDKGKNADLLIEYFCRYAGETDPNRTLVFIGGGEVQVPDSQRSRIVQLGFLPQQDKYDCYAAALALCVPSVTESFSIVMMESWLAGRPVIVNRACAVTTDYCRRSNGGLYFSDYEEFREIVKELARNPATAGILGQQGRRFVCENYSPERVVDQYLRALKELKI